MVHVRQNGKIWPEEEGQGHRKVGHQHGRIVVHFYQVSSKSDHNWRSYMDLKFRVFRTKMGLWPWKVGQGHWNWVSVLRSTWGPYLYRFRGCPINFVWKEKKQRILDNCNCHGQLPGFTIMNARMMVCIVNVQNWSLYTILTEIWHVEKCNQTVNDRVADSIM